MAGRGRSCRRAARETPSSRAPASATRADAAPGSWSSPRCAPRCRTTGRCKPATMSSPPDRRSARPAPAWQHLRSARLLPGLSRCSRSEAAAARSAPERCSPDAALDLDHVDHGSAAGITKTTWSASRRNARTGTTAPWTGLARDLLAALADRAGRLAHLRASSVWRPPGSASSSDSKRITAASRSRSRLVSASPRACWIRMRRPPGDGTVCRKSWLLCVRTALHEPAGKTLVEAGLLGQASAMAGRRRGRARAARQAAAAAWRRRARSAGRARPADRSSRWRCRSCPGSGRGCRAVVALPSLGRAQKFRSGLAPDDQAALAVRGELLRRDRDDHLPSGVIVLSDVTG